MPKRASRDAKYANVTIINALIIDKSIWKEQKSICGSTQPNLVWFNPNLFWPVFQHAQPARVASCHLKLNP